MILPAENRRQRGDPRKRQVRLKFALVSHMGEVLPVALAEMPEPRSARDEVEVEAAES